ncbi:hypothetical protein ColLi_12673 [Colletotrichum liriopes]|uniref:Uncharacterized protein n=1 Tax=Colletotrichum liriopes TaxID=708192 RepID=A0AA37H029_9PEZI|nr:hypothetical protein ColLi_12673 [Colletotrichum liriopes]
MISFKTYSIVRIVLVLLVTIPALAIFGLLFRKPGYRHDNTRRWVDYTKIASGIWGFAQTLQILQQIIFVAYYDDTRGWFEAYPARDASFALGFIGSMLEVWAAIAIFLALFYLAHALTQLRTEGQEDSSAYRKGRKVALGVSGFLFALNLVTLCLALASNFPASWDDHTRAMNLVASCFSIASAGIVIICAIGSVVYSAKSRKKALGSPVQKVRLVLTGGGSLRTNRVFSQAATILVVCSSLYLVRAAWYIVIFFYGIFEIFAIIDVFVGCWIPFVILVLLYFLATKEDYSLSKTHYRSRTVADSQAA